MSDLDLVDLMTRPAARGSDPITSHHAATRAASMASKNRLLALRLLAEKSRTDFELATASGLQQTSIGVRRGELVKHGYAEMALDGRGEKVTRLSPSGSPALVWQITASGRAFLASLT